MKTLWYIAKKDLLQILRDRNALLVLLIAPLLLIVVVGFALGNAFGNGSNQITITVAVSNQDSGYIGSTIVNALHVNSDQLKITVHPYDNLKQVTDQFANNSNVNAGIVIPAGTTDKFIAATRAGTTPKNLVQFYSPASSNDPRVTIVQNIVTGVLSSQFAANAAVGQVDSVCSQRGNHCAQSSIHTQAITAAVGQASASGGSSVQALLTGKTSKTNSFDLVLPGYAVFFALFGINAAAATILQEKEDGTFRRLLIAPTQKYALLGGKLLAQFILTLGQLAFFFIVGYFAFHLDIGSLPAVIALLIGTSFAATGLGILLVSVVKTRRQLNPVVIAVILVSSAIGGAWWPLFIEPQWMQQLAKIGLTAWAMEGLNGVMIAGKDFVQVAPDILGLLGYGLICFVIALKLFRFQEKAA
jgi:ABC-2 type transport system permease protein